MKGNDALSQALVWLMEGVPIINVRSTSHDTNSDDWVIETKDASGYNTIREIPKEVE